MEYSAEHKPFFSIVIPAFNREKEILRAINSCLTQSFTDFEVVVVDDASTDQTVAVVEGVKDGRMRLVRHAVNRNVSPARNTGSSHSLGEWIVFLDSDDILLPGALQKIWAEAVNCPAEIAQLGFLFDREDGRLSPEPIPQECVLDYIGYMKFRNDLVLSDWVQCTRRSTFDFVKFPDSRAYESPYLLDFTQKYMIRLIPETVGFKYLDSANRITSSSGREKVNKIVRDAPEHLAAAEYLLARHGTTLRKYAPRRYHVFRKMQLLFSFLAGQRWKGSKLSIEYVSSYPGDLSGWVIWMAGLIGPRTLAKVRLAKVKTQKTFTKPITSVKLSREENAL